MGTCAGARAHLHAPTPICLRPANGAFPPPIVAFAAPKRELTVSRPLPPPLHTRLASYCVSVPPLTRWEVDGNRRRFVHGAHSHPSVPMGAPSRAARCVGEEVGDPPCTLTYGRMHREKSKGGMHRENPRTEKKKGKKGSPPLGLSGALAQPSGEERGRPFTRLRPRGLLKLGLRPSPTVVGADPEAGAAHGSRCSQI